MKRGRSWLGPDDSGKAAGASAPKISESPTRSVSAARRADQTKPLNGPGPFCTPLRNQTIHCHPDVVGPVDRADADFAAVDLEMVGADVFAAELEGHCRSARAASLSGLMFPRPRRRGMPFWEQPTPALADWRAPARTRWYDARAIVARGRASGRVSCHFDRACSTRCASTNARQPSLALGARRLLPPRNR